MASTQTTVTRKGQITIPIDVRRELNINEGDRLDVERHGDVVILRLAVSVAKRTAGALSAYRLANGATPQEEDAAFAHAIADEVRGSLEDE